jgi:D-3-phosphoglycerate dehydrogenase / 2-oxoglutarate reductase
MIKILANDGISEEGKLKLESKGFFVSTSNIEQSKLAEEINKQNYQVLLVRSATTARKDLIDACPNLKMIGRGGVGMDNIDVAYAQSKGIEVVNTPASSSQSVAELVFAHLFNMVRFVYDANRQMPIIGASNFNDLKKKYAKGIELRNKTLGIIGFGRIGQSVASYALGCGMKVLAVDNHLTHVNIDLKIQGTANVKVGINTIGLDELLAKSDFISIHVPKQNNGNAVITKNEFAKMKKGVVLVNAARGGVIDETALMESLDNGIVAHAALDVFENEPKPNEALLIHPKISLTPHIGAATVEAQDRIGLELADIIISFFK